jgi:hypothetical protein
LYDLVQSIRRYNEDEEDLVLNFKYDNLILDNFIQFFKEHDQDIALNVRKLLSNATKSLEATLHDTCNRLALHRHDDFRRQGYMDLDQIEAYRGRAKLYQLGQPNETLVGKPTEAAACQLIQEVCQ